MKARKYTLVELWNDLDVLTQEFFAKEEVPADNEADQQAFDLAHNTIQALYHIGRQAEQISFFFHPYEKACLGLKAKNIFHEQFGEDKMAKIKGKKSLAYVKEVILPFEDNTKKIEHEWWLVMLCGLVGMDLAAEAQEAGRIADEYRKAISAFESSVARLGLFAVTHNAPALSADNKRANVLDIRLG